MKGLTLKSPYHALMLHGKIETRTWNTAYRGKVLLTSSLKYYSLEEVEAMTTPEIFISLWNIVKKEINENQTKKLPGVGFGQAYAIADLVDCKPMQKENEALCFVKFDPQLKCHFFKNVQRIQPFSITGKVGYWDVSEEDQKKIVLL